MIGAFQQPQVVLADMSQLSTLPDRELSAGLAEVIKYALLGDEEFLVWLEANMEGLIVRDEQLLAEAVYRSCAHKARIVANDEKNRVSVLYLISVIHLVMRLSLIWAMVNGCTEKL